MKWTNVTIYLRMIGFERLTKFRVRRRRHEGKTPPARPWQFSLKNLLIAFTLVAILFGLLTWNYLLPFLFLVAVFASFISFSVLGVKEWDLPTVCLIALTTLAFTILLVFLLSPVILIVKLFGY